MSDQALSSDKALYIDDRELHRRLAPHMGWDSFKAAIRTLETDHDDFPRVSPLFRGRYFPKVQTWLDAHNGVGSNATSDVQDGPENFDASPQQNTRLKTRAAQPALLDRASGRPRPYGLPRQVHPAPARRG